MSETSESVKLSKATVEYVRAEAERRGCFMGQVFMEAIHLYKMERLRVEKIHRKIARESRKP